tara:strand:+ start:557 stop:802 length:246 start_codon:yes stop_codon:yes gene_type:complete
MRKIIDGLAIFAGLVSLSIVGAGGYVYMQRAEITESIKSKVTAEIGKAIGGALPVALDGAMPDIPSTTGLPLPVTPKLPGF